MRGANVIKTGRARRLRRHSTDAERKLWNHLRSRAINGFKFVRQEPIGPYVVDFICRERRLVTEVDGGQHAIDKRDSCEMAGSPTVVSGCHDSGTTTCPTILKEF
jgi:very-short-patch-repair endonuclease